MDIAGVGIDILAVDRIVRLVEEAGDSFNQRWFSDGEIEWCADAMEPGRGQAELFAAKEAVWKSLRLDWAGAMPWRHIVIDPDVGRHRVRLEGEVGRAAALRGITQVDVTTSRLDGMVLAVAIAQSG